MKVRIFGSLLLLLMLLVSCTPRIYGVPEDRWATMSEQERVAAMEAYKARQETLRQQREEQARLRAMEKEAQLAREAEEARRRQMRVEAIYRGEGRYGELLRVGLDGGLLQFHGVHKPFHPLAFRIAAGETKDVEVVSINGRKARMKVQYDGSNLLLDEAPNPRRSTAIRLPYEDSWEAGTTYPHLAAQGPLEIRGVDVTVRIIGQPPRDPHSRFHRPHGAMKAPIENSPGAAVVAIKDPERRPKPDVRVVDRRPQIKKPAGVVVKPHPGADQHGKFIGHGVHKVNAVPEPPARIKVAFQHGRFTVKKSSYPLVPQTIDLHEGQSRDVILRGHNSKLKVRVSYSGGELLIDDAPGRDRRRTRMGFAPGWKNGQTYAIETCGNGLLKDLDFMVTSQ